MSSAPSWLSVSVEERKAAAAPPASKAEIDGRKRNGFRRTSRSWREGEEKKKKRGVGASRSRTLKEGLGRLPPSLYQPGEKKRAPATSLVLRGERGKGEGAFLSARLKKQSENSLRPIRREKKEVKSLTGHRRCRERLSSLSLRMERKRGGKRPA